MDYTSRIPPEELVEMLTIEAGGFSRICHAAIPHLRRTAGGIVAVTSAALNRHVPKDTLSTAPKAAIEAMVRALAREEGRFGVRANSVRVGVVDGGMFHHFAGSDGAIDEAWVSAATENVALRRLGTPDEVGAVIAFLLSAGATYVSGQAIAVDGGFAI
ncbi:MAG: NAD(P)-dependent dehydrogenase (short-subunit alcohol dehydrogenase family) [Bradymonadia bacterium]|jgi:NAD(P)-dependent dehydrogenase (short-subunit alcohol dehydrogenase family)